MNNRARSLRRALGSGSYDEIEIVRSILPRRSGTMVDVGAHHGSSLLRFARNGWRVWAFEPDRANRADLEGRIGGMPTVHVDPRAVSDVDCESRQLYTSHVSTGISALAPFHPSHHVTSTVQTVRLDTFMAEHDIDEVTFLKTDTEGHDLIVLRTFPWHRIRPMAVVCEFEDRKSLPLGCDYHQTARLLTDLGYAVFVSEWYPVVEYGQKHRWRRVRRYPAELADPNAWGNLIAVQPDAAAQVWARARQAGRRYRLRRRAERIPFLERRLAMPVRSARSGSTKPAAPQKAQKPAGGQGKSRFDQRYDQFTGRLSPTVAGLVDLSRPSFRRPWGGPLNGQERRREIVQEIARSLRFDRVVETGTYRGTSTSYFATAFGCPVSTVESERRFFAYSRARLLHRRGIQVTHGDSRKFLRRLAKGAGVEKETVFFYLDAHWKNDLPLREELKIIAGRWQRAVVMIDDFQVPDDKGYRFDNYGKGRRLSEDYLPKAALQDWSILYPAAGSGDETGKKRGCCVLVTRELAGVASGWSTLRSGTSGEVAPRNGRSPITLVERS